jgi:hypothetical protein
MKKPNNNMGAFGALPKTGGHGNAATVDFETANSGFRRLFSVAVLTFLATKEEVLNYVTARVTLSLAVLAALFPAQCGSFEAAIRFLRAEISLLEGEIGRLPVLVPETEPSPHWPDSWPMRLLAFFLLLLIGGLAVLGLINCMQFAVLTTNNWWTAGLFAAPMLSVPFALKYVFEVVPPRSRSVVYVFVGFVGAASVGAFVYTFANRFGLTAVIGDATDVQDFLIRKEDNRLQVAAQMLTELSCGTALVLWFRRIMLGAIRGILNPLRQQLEEVRSQKQIEIKALEEQLGRVQGELAALAQRRQAAIAEGLATWYSIKEAAANRALLQNELECAVAA